MIVLNPADGRRRLQPDSLFLCDTLSCVLAAKECVRRQATNDMRSPGTRDSWRGQGPVYPTCISSCVEGRVVRLAMPRFRPRPAAFLARRSATNRREEPWLTRSR